MLTRISTTGSEPVSLEVAKLAARVDSDDLDTLIQSWITAGREAAEHLTGRQFRSGGFRWSGADWPAKELPVLGADGAQVMHWDGVRFVELDGSAYVCTEAIEHPGTIVAPALGAVWPALPPIAAGARVQIVVTVDVNPDLVPACVKTFICANVAAWLKNPEALTGASVVCNPLYDRLLDQLVVFYR